MRFDDLYLWYLADPSMPRYIGALKLVAAGKGVSLHYASDWLAMALLSNDLPLVDTEHAPPGRLAADQARAVGAVDDARPDRWGEKVIRYMDKPKRHSVMEYLYYAGDDRFGALGVSTSATDYTPRAGSPLPRLEQAQALSDAVARIEASEPLNALQAKLVRVGSSLGGAKPKALIEIAGEQWECIIGFRNADSRGRAATK
jgi:serine/threonine-protein kinase HipA